MTTDAPEPCSPDLPDQAADLREAFEERAAILEFDACLPRLEAELEAVRITATLARNRGATCGRPYARP